MWSVEKKRLLIDSLLNGFDIPKIYLHEHATPIEVDGRRVRFSLIDGRQRLEAIWGFLDGEFALADDFTLLEDGAAGAAGKTFNELEQSDDLIAAFLTSINLDVCVIRTDDIELIEEMFSRLNEAVPLNAAEKRNGRGGVLRPIVRELVTHPFFTDKVPFDNTRYRHFDLALKFMLWAEAGRPVDAKKRQLDEFWDDNKSAASEMSGVQTRVASALDVMAPVFEDNDRLLANVGMISVYFLAFDRRLRHGQPIPQRHALLQFNIVRSLESFEREESLSPTMKDYLEFDSLAQRMTDGYALEFRLEVLDRYLNAHA
ncbi:hypothetical protein N798_09335 [Knoellia flava TL1]|uniref:GmrSD restriction endonucleases N-terminal domain-containing protein n=1 Tax=Knoellia flava TL1 TaxID=1385518 RepID=A0ABR4XDI9_9MICO|nr:hypothetical protein N798_09335 [Knoellia flava TL1]